MEGTFLLPASVSSPETSRICLKQDTLSFIHENIVNLYISYKLDIWSRDLNTAFTLANCLFGTVKLTKNNYPDKNEYSYFGIGIDAKLSSDNNRGKNDIFGVDNSSSVHIDNKNRIF